MSLLKFRRTINHYGRTNYVNVPPVLIELMKAQDSKEVWIEDDLENDCIRIRFIKEGKQ